MSIRKLLQLFVILFVLFFISCNQKRQEETIDDPRDMELPRKVTDSLWRRAINEGDFDAYHTIANSNMLLTPDEYYYTLLMANKHQCPEAYLNLYDILTWKGTIDGVEVAGKDSISRNQALFYLLKAYELSEKSAIYSIYEEFGEGVTPPKSMTYLKKIQQFYEEKK
jgi:cytochrome oxidase assembly protein ShyY1